MKSICYALCGLLFFSCARKEKADLIVKHAVIYRADSSFSTCTAMAISNGIIVATGTDDEITKSFDAKSTIDADGRTILPGLIDAHCHFAGFATDQWKCQLTGTRSFDEVLEKVKNFASKTPEGWIYGRGWDQNDWPIHEFPDKTKLDQMFPDRPVFLKRVDGHAALANQKALDMAGINAATHVDGGMVMLKNGKLTGILLDNAMDMVDKIVPLPSADKMQEYFQKLQYACVSKGLTMVTDCGISSRQVELLQEFHKSGKMKMRLFALLSELSDTSVVQREHLLSGDRFRVGGIKVYADGALGSRGACLLQDYSDLSGSRGMLLTPAKRLKEIANQIHQTKLQMCTHAIGDSANRLMLDIYGSVLGENNDRRWRIEHAQVVNDADVPKFGKYGVVPSVQPTHATSDMYWAGERLGKERIKSAYAYRGLLESSGKLALGTDFPVEQISPFKTFYAAVVRKDTAGFPSGGFQMENSLTREQALLGMTRWAAWSVFMDKVTGSIEKGKRADFIMLDRDILKIPESQILGTSVLATFVNGEQVFSR